MLDIHSVEDYSWPVLLSDLKHFSFVNFDMKTFPLETLHPVSCGLSHAYFNFYTYTWCF